MDARFIKPGFEQCLAHVVEESGEVMTEVGKLLAAAGKTQRHGPLSVNPLLPAEERETNVAWIVRQIPSVKVEIEDLLIAISRLETEIKGSFS